MGTRSTTKIYELNNIDGKEKKMLYLSLYCQYDGYHEGWGKNLKNFFKSKKMVNGIEMGKEDKVFNGIGCFALQLVKEYKEAGGKYSGKKDDKKGLGRWFKEKWTNQRKKKDTPAQKKKAIEEKKKTGRVKKFKKKVKADSGETSPEEKKVEKNKYNYYSKKKV